MTKSRAFGALRLALSPDLLRSQPLSIMNMTHMPLTRFTIVVLSLFLVSAQAPAADAVAVADDYHSRGDLESALITLKSLLQSDPNNAAGRVALGRVYLDLRQGAMAEQELNRALALGTSRDEIAADLARSLLQQGAYARALDAAALSDGLAEGARRAELLALQAAAHAGMQDTDSARTAVTLALEADPANEEALLEQARLDWSAGARDRAREILAQAEAAHPKSPDVAAALAEVAMADGHLDDVDAILTDAVLSQAPERWMLLYLRARARSGAGDSQGALADIAAGEKLYPEFVGYQLVRGQLLFEQGQYADALVHLRNFLRANPGDPTANLIAGAAELKEGNPELARDYLTRHLDALPDSNKGKLLLAAVQFGQRDLKGAAQTLKPLIGQQPPEADAQKMLAQVYTLEGNLNEAIRLYRSYLQLQPDDADAQVRLSVLLAQTGDQSAAQAQADAAVAADPSSVSGRLQQVDLAIRQHDAKRAAELAAALVKDYPRSGPAHAAYAAAYAAVGDVESARRQLEQGWKVDPAFTESAFKLARLATTERKFDEARRYYEAILVQEPSNSAATLLLAQLDWAEGHADLALKRLQDALRQDPTATDIRLSLANGYLKADRLEDARRVMQGVPPGVADDPRVLLAQGQLALISKEPYAAVRLLEGLVQRAPESAEAHYLLAAALAAANNPSEAGSSLATAFKLDPANDKALPAVQAVLAAMPTFSAKQQLIADLQAANPDQPRGAYFEALMLQETAKPDQSLAILSDLHEQHPDDRLYYNTLLTQQARAEEKAAAIATASGWLARHRDDARASRQLAELYVMQGDRVRAVDTYKALVATSPEDVVALNNLADLLREDQPAEALEYAKRAHAAAPANPAIRDTLGMALLATGDLAGALENLEAAYKDAAGNPQVELHYAQALIAAGKRDQARTLLQELASKSFDGADEAKTLLDQLK